MKKGKAKRRRSRGVYVFLLLPLLTCAGAMIPAALIISGKLPESAMQTAALCTVGVIAFVTAWITAARAEERKLLCGLGLTVLYAALLLSCNVLFFGQGYGDLLTEIIVLMVSGLLGTLPGARKKRKRI